MTDLANFASVAPLMWQKLLELAKLFLKLGLIGFGGPPAHIALMEDEVVRKRGWLSHQEFLDLVSATHLIPGPNSTELAIHIGLMRAGWLGLLVAGACFILPAMTIVILVAWFYQNFGTLPAIQGFLYGIKPAMIAIIFDSARRLSLPHKFGSEITTIMACAFFARILGAPDLLIILVAGLAAMANQRRMLNSKSLILAFLFLLTAPVAWASLEASMSGTPFTQSRLFLFFLKTGSVLYGSGYVLLAFLEQGLVRDYDWLTSQQLMDAIAVGQFTPGPVLTTATFIGYILAGTTGAVVATVAIFLPAFLLVPVSARGIQRLRQSARWSSFLDGLNAGSLGLLWAIGIIMATELPREPATFLLAGSTLIALTLRQVNSMWLMLGAAAIGILLKT